MTRKSSVALLSLFLIAFLAVSAFGANQWAKGVNTHIPANLKATTLKAELAGADKYYAPVVGEEGNYDDASVSREGFLSDDGSAKAVVVPGPAVGQTMGYTTYDYQHNSRMTRQVAWYGDDLHYVHFAWMKKNNDVDGAGTYRMTAYQYWNTAGAGTWERRAAQMAPTTNCIAPNYRLSGGGAQVLFRGGKKTVSGGGRSSRRSRRGGLRGA